MTRDPEVAAWVHVVRDLRFRIDQGQFESGEQLPSEMELAADYELNRLTVRRALQVLEEDQYIDRIHGRGTFVRKGATPLLHDLSLLSPWRSRLLESGRHVASTIVTTEQVRGVPRTVLRAFDIDGAGSPVWNHLVRVQRVDGEAIAVSESWVPHTVAPNLYAVGLVDGSLSRTLREHFGISHPQVESQISIGLARAEEADLLGSYRDVPVLVVLARSSLGATQPLIELSRTVWLGSRVSFRFVREALPTDD